MDAIDIQKQINHVYEDALVKVITAANAPLDREQLNKLVLGGQHPAELPRWTVEPYVPALAKLVNAGTLVQYQNHAVPEDDEMYGAVLFDLRERTSPENIENSDKLRDGQPVQNWNDPSNWRVDLDEAAEYVVNISKSIVASFLMKHAARQGMELEKGDGTVH